MAERAAIAARHISKSYGAFRAIHDLSFEVCGGEVFALLGPNGSGKTTTIRMVLDILKPDSGSIDVLGAPINNRVKDRIGYLPEERGLYRGARVLEMMMYLGMLKGLARSAARQRSLELLDKLELAEHARSKVSELSKGMQQKVQFAVTILHQPDLIIIDEPFSGLDPVNTLVIKTLLQDLRQQGTAVVMSTHQMHQVEEMADRLLMLHRGEQKLYGSVTDVRARYAEHAVIIEGEGDWSALPGVARVEARANGRGGVTLYLEANTTPDMLLKAAAQSDSMHIQRFERAVPALNDIFIRVAGESRE